MICETFWLVLSGVLGDVKVVCCRVGVGEWGGLPAVNIDQPATLTPPGYGRPSLYWLQIVKLSVCKFRPVWGCYEMFFPASGNVTFELSSVLMIDNVRNLFFLWWIANCVVFSPFFFFPTIIVHISVPWRWEPRWHAVRGAVKIRQFWG